MPTFAPIPRLVLASGVTDIAVAVALAAAGLVGFDDGDDVAGSVVGVDIDEDDIEADVEVNIEVGDDVEVEPDSVASVDVDEDKEVVIEPSGADHVVAERSDL